jgi:hypothetical protein
MKTSTPFGADFIITHLDNFLKFVIIKDLDKGNKSVTNDAEAVVKRMLLEVGRDKRIFYYDSTNELDELCHDGVKFTGFAFGMPEEFKKECGI